ncbi:NAD(P)/FAD-dependent oxidoreductase [Thalassococcus lentus]|uniref:FAD-dependent oxidoreductase n=1 Tax=Thalassococcus lentus TaxID=1210524 RepID=A0ABT4XTS3_9RHOB|nr:FAD-dependent oxidoreductase [Thalassococcus lentus]MDA7425369.1 FAD-dependent oxidoreductase [Thalassococcus lentus]
MAQKVVVVGAGILGAQAAYRMQSAGADVTVIDKRGPGGVATAASFGWINASFYLDDHHFALRRSGMAAWQRLIHEVDLPVQRCGALSWEHQGPALDAECASLSAKGYAVEVVGSGTIRSLVPSLGNPPDRALWFADEMAAESEQVAARLLQLAVSKGARLLTGAAVTGVSQQAGTVTGVQTEAGAIAADEVLLCTGTQSGPLLAPLGIEVPMARRPALMLRTRPVAQCLGPVLVTPAGEIRQLPDGSILMPAAIGHQGASDETLTGTPEDAERDGLARLRALFPDLTLEIAGMMLAQRPYPADGLPVVGSVAKGVTLAVMHSGITLGALMGELLCGEILDGPSNVSSDLLAPYRPDRFQ